MELPAREWKVCFRGFVVVCVHGGVAAVSTYVGGLGVCMIGCWLVEGCVLLVARVPVLLA